MNDEKPEFTVERPLLYTKGSSLLSLRIDKMKPVLERIPENGVVIIEDIPVMEGNPKPKITILSRMLKKIKMG